MSVNLINPQLIRDYLLGFVKGAEHADQLGDYLVLALDKPLRKDQRYHSLATEPPNPMPEWMISKWGKIDFFEFRATSKLDVNVEHIRDWILGALVRGEAWLYKVDDQGRPRKLLKIGSVEQALKEADKAIELSRQKFAKDSKKDAAFAYELEHGDLAIVHEFEDEFKIVKLLSTVAAGREEYLMQHCIGNGSYDYIFEEDPKDSIYSLRDAKNNPHVTIHVQNDNLMVIQCVGKQNVSPAAKYLPKLFEFFDLYTLNLDTFYKSIGAFFQDDALHFIQALPDDFTVKGSLDIRRIEDFKCPKNLTVERILHLYETQRPSIEPCFKSLYRIAVGHHISHNIHKIILYLPDWQTVVGENWYWFNAFSGYSFNREGGPTIIRYFPGTKIRRYEAWYNQDKLHREDGPAMITRVSVDDDRIKARWYYKGQLQKIEKTTEREFFD